MPKLNRQLMSTIIIDIKELVTVGDEMYSWIGKIEHLSWRFPSRSAKNVNAIGVVQKHKGSAGEMYILLLEMAYDRVHFVLRLVIEFMDGYPFVEGPFEKMKNPKKSASMSLASMIKILWSRLKTISETITQKTLVKTKRPDHPPVQYPISRGCQASGSLSHCESCSTASKSIAYLTGALSNALKDNGLSSVIIKERDMIRADLFDKTQWDVMTRLTEAIATDIDTLIEITSITRSKSEADAREYKNSLDSLRTELEKQKVEKMSLQTEIETTKSRLLQLKITAECELKTLKSREVELVQENCTSNSFLVKAEKKSSNLEALLDVTLKQLAEMGECKIELENTVRNLREELASTRYANLRETKELGKILEHHRDENDLLKTQHRKKIEDLEQRLGEVIEKLEVKSKQLELAESITDEKINPEEVAETLSSKGDPEIDMSQQLASNEAAIERLSRQNERLSNTLGRLREHRRSSRTN